MKPAHPVVILKDSRFEDALQVKGFPTVGVIDPEGNLTYAGFRGKEETFVEEGAQRSETGELWPEKLLKKALKLVQAGEEARAYGETLKAIEKATEEADAKWLKRYSAYLEGRAVTAVADSRKYLEEGRVLRALQRAEPYAEAKPQFPSSSDAAAFLTELEALPTYKAELKGGKKFEEALALEKEREFLDAAKVYVAVYKKYKDTKVAAAQA